MNGQGSDLVVKLADVAVVPLVFGPYVGSRIGLPAFKNREWPNALNCQVRFVPSGSRAPLLNAGHSAEEIGFVVSGVGEYHAADEVIPIERGDFLLAPEGMTGQKFEITNTGSEDLLVIAFEAERHHLDQRRRDRARAVIEAFIKKRCGGKTSYTFDGRILTIFWEHLRGNLPMLITYDQFGSLWISGCPLPEDPGENIEGTVEKMVKATQVLLGQAYRAP